MSNETYWALKRREWAAREQRSSRRRNVPLRGPRHAVAAPAAPIPTEVLEETAAEIVEVEQPEYDSVPEADEPSYRDLQAQAKELDIKANQPADKLKKAIEKAG